MSWTRGVWSVSETGTPQGAVISPLLANVLLDDVFDLRAQQWRRRDAKGEMIVVRYADDLVAGLEHEAEATAFWEAMRERLERFALALHGGKTRLLAFGRLVAGRRRQAGLGKPVRGGFLLLRKTRGDLAAFKKNCKFSNEPTPAAQADAAMNPIGACAASQATTAQQATFCGRARPSMRSKVSCAVWCTSK